MRTNDGLCDAVWIVSESSRGSATETNGSSGRCMHLLRAERVLEHVIGRREGALDIAAAQLVVERDVGVRAGP